MKILIFLLLLLASCASSKKETTEEEKKEPEVTGPEKRIIGRIASVSRAGEFVLIQKFGPGALPKNTIYQSQGPSGRSASLKPSGERVRDFYAADLISGKVEKGDAVVGYPDHQKEEENTETAPQSEEAELKNAPSNEKKSPEEQTLKSP